MDKSKTLKDVLQDVNTQTSWSSAIGSTSAQFQPMPAHQPTCPNCGYCQHCGRSNGWGQYTSPYYYYTNVCRTNTSGGEHIEIK
jgi:hypothetical protein